MNFAEWIKNNWNIAGGLITQVVAAKILGKTKTRIRQMINEEKLAEYIFENNTYVSYAEVMKIHNEQQEKMFREMTLQEAMEYEDKEHQEAEAYWEYLQTLSPEERAEQEAKDKAKWTKKAAEKAINEAKKAEESLKKIRKNL